MLTVSIQVNGCLISHVYITRDRDAIVYPSPDDELGYTFEIYRPGTGVIHRGHLHHRYGDGAEELIHKVLKHYRRYGTRPRRPIG